MASSLEPDEYYVVSDLETDTQDESEETTKKKEKGTMLRKLR